MTPSSKGYAAYANNRVLTASPAELTLMLYDGAIKFGNIARTAIEKGEVEKAHNNIMKVRNIITEFQATLNHSYEVSKEFNRVYDYIKFCLTEANVKKDIEMMDRALSTLRVMRETWKQVMELNRTMKANN